MSAPEHSGPSLKELLIEKGKNFEAYIDEIANNRAKLAVFKQQLRPEDVNSVVQFVTGTIAPDRANNFDNVVKKLCDALDIKPNHAPRLKRYCELFDSISRVQDLENS